MKRTDIKVGEEYAERRGQYGHATRVRVLDNAAEIRGRYTFSPSTLGVRVQVLNATTGEPFHRPGERRLYEMTIPARQILMPWAEHAERAARAEAADADARARKEAVEARHTARYAALLTALDARGVARPPVAREWHVDGDKVTAGNDHPYVPAPVTTTTIEVPVAWLLDVLGVPDPTRSDT